MITLELPYPPTVNTYWQRNRNGSVRVGDKGKQFRSDVFFAVAEQKGKVGYDGPVSVTIEAYPPDKRKRDLDNINKALLDGLGHAGVYIDDSQIVKLTSVKCEPVIGGKVIVTVKKVRKKAA